MGFLLGLLNRMPASWIRAVGNLRGKSPFIKRLTNWIPNMMRNRESRIQKGLGAGLRFNPGNSAVGFLLGTHDLEVQHAIHQLVKPGSIAFDIGANVGFTALLSAKQAGPNGHVVCFEPLSSNAEGIRHNAALNDVKTISVHQVAVGESDGEAEFQTSESPTWGRLTEAGATPMAAGKLKVKVRSLDSLLAEGAIPLPQFIKMDVEGAEAAAIRGGRALLTRARPCLVIEMHHTYADVVKAFEGLNYAIRVLTPGVSSTEGEFQILAYPAENSELDSRWQKLVTQSAEFEG